MSKVRVDWSEAVIEYHSAVFDSEVLPDLRNVFSSSAQMDEMRSFLAGYGGEETLSSRVTKHPKVSWFGAE